jgi:hypothetical protein
VGESILGNKFANKALRLAIAAAIMSGAVTVASAAGEEVANIARITGNTLVNKGAQYVPGTEGMELSIGERVMSLEDTTAVIQFKDGCRYTMEENEVITIPRLSPCVLTKGSGNRLSALPPVPPAEPPLVVPIVPAAAAAPAASLSWVPLAGVGLVAISGIVFDPGDNENGRRPPISP